MNNLPNSKKETRRPDSYDNKILPHAVELEEAVLGALMTVDDQYTRHILSILNPNVFYRESNKDIAEAIISLKKEGVFPDILMVVEHLKKQGKNMLGSDGMAYHVSVISNKFTTTANLTFQYAIVQQRYVQREFILMMNDRIQDAFSDGCDIFELLESAEKQLRKINPTNKEAWEQDSKDVSATVSANIIEPASSGIFLYYNTGWPIFDKYVGTSKNKVIVLGGASGHGKSRFLSSWMFKLLDQYPEDMGIFWCTFEDSAEDILLFYLSQKFKIKAKEIKKRNFDKSLVPQIKEYIEKWKAFDLHFVDRWNKISWIKARFEAFCDKRPDKFPILIIDNLLSLKDRQDFKGNENSMYDYVMTEIQSIRQSTHALIIVVHHYNDHQLSKERIKEGYRPTVQDLKGTERIRGVANQVLLINNPKNLKDLVAEYHDQEKEILKNLFIIDPGKIRDDSNSDEESLIHFWNIMDYLIFEEIPK